MVTCKACGGDTTVPGAPAQDVKPSQQQAAAVELEAPEASEASAFADAAGFSSTQIEVTQPVKTRSHASRKRRTRQKSQQTVLVSAAVFGIGAVLVIVIWVAKAKGDARRIEQLERNQQQLVP